MEALFPLKVNLTPDFINEPGVNRATDGTCCLLLCVTVSETQLDTKQVAYELGVTAYCLNQEPWVDNFNYVGKDNAQKLIGLIDRIFKPFKVSVNRSKYREGTLDFPFNPVFTEVKPFQRLVDNLFEYRDQLRDQVLDWKHINEQTKPGVFKKTNNWFSPTTENNSQ